MVLALGGGMIAAQAQDSSAVSTERGLEDTVAFQAALMESRRDVASSRSGSRILLGAERLEAIEGQARKEIRELRQRQARREARERAAERRRAARLEARQWGAPLADYSISSVFGEVSYVRSGAHTGVDLNAVTGAPVTSVGPGSVTFAGYDGAYGYKVVVRHTDGSRTWYCHLSSISVGVGQAVTNETLLGRVGATGNVTGDHLHLELHPAGGGPVDPVSALAAHGVHL